MPISIFFLKRTTALKKEDLNVDYDG